MRITKDSSKLNFKLKLVIKNVNYNFFHIINRDLKRIGCYKQQIKAIYNKMKRGKAKAVTISNIDYHTSVVLFNNHTTLSDYINSIVHEAEHIKQSMLYAYNVKDEGEKPAYTIGYIGSKLLDIFI